MSKAMNTVGNIFWLIFGGILNGLASFIVGLFLCCTIIFIPVGVQYFKMGRFFFGPMGKEVVENKPSGFKTVINILYCLLGGWENALYFLVLALFFAITIIGIPFARQYVKLAKFILLPLGHDFE